MNIIEAIESGKRFRRVSQNDWYESSEYYVRLSRESIMADDWEVESEAVTITEQQFNLAVQRTLHEMDPDEHGFWDKLRKNIGL